MRPYLLSAFAVPLTIATLVACGNDSTAPTQAPVGSYTAIIFVTTGASGQTNQLQNGSSLSINLAADGTTTGHLHVAASGSNPVFDADMAGTWTMNGDKVTFGQTADTFVRNLEFTVQPLSTQTWSLVADRVVNGTRFNITLAQHV